MSDLLSQLSLFSSWVYSPYAFAMSTLAKSEFEKNAYFYYEDPCFRYFRAQRFMNLQSVEMQWINDLCHRYSNGDPNNLIVVAGDWCKDRSATLKRGSSPASYNDLKTHGRVMCNACCSEQKYIIHNRDVNASRNIYRLAVQLLTRGGRPKDIPQYVPKDRR